MNYVREYWDKIQSGELTVCNKIYLQYERSIDIMDHPEDYEPYVFNEDVGEDVIDFIETFCKHSKGKWAGKPITLDLWQKARIQTVYGFIDKHTGFRMINEAITIVARKNGKSTEKSATGLYMMIGDGESGFEGYSAATKKDQARIVFTEMCNMVGQSAMLSEVLQKRKSDLYFQSTLSKFQPLASDSNSLDGLNSAYIIIDELHGLKDRNLYDVLKQSTSAREQPLLDVITTAGFNREGIYDNLYDYADKVLNGEIENLRFAAFIYELDEKDEWLLPDMWIKANPGLGSMKTAEYIAENVERAKVDSDFLPTVLTKDFNIRETSAGSWLTFDELSNEETFDLEDFRGHYGIAGTDLSSVSDLTSSTILLKKKDDPTKTYVHQMNWIPEELIEKKVHEDKVPYDKWIQQGWVRACEGNRINQSDVTKWHIEMMHEHGIYVYYHGYDDWNANYWVEDMRNQGWQMEVVRQGAKTFSGPMKHLKADLSANNVVYNNNPVLKWAMTNVSVERDKNDNIRPIKGSNKKQRIDPIVSLIDAWVVMLAHIQDFTAMLK